MVHTRSKTAASPKPNDTLRLIREKVEELANSRQINRLRSPSKRYALKQKRMAKKDAIKFERLITNVKENLSKASERNLPELPAQPPTLFDQIHDPIKSGEAKRNLKPVVIVIHDD